MSFRMAVLLSLSLFVGCQKPKMPGFITKFTKTTSDEGAKAPPRTTFASDAPSSIPMGETDYEGSSIRLTDYSGDEAPAELFGATVVATVNSLPIFADDVLQPHTLNLEKAQRSHSILSPVPSLSCAHISHRTYRPSQTLT